MTDITTTIAADINRLHDLASQRAAEAIDYAKQVGQLLIQAKATLKHGEWLPWLEQNVRVSVRQAQRYIAVAEGRPVAVRQLASKSDTVSHSEPTTPGFVPTADSCYIHTSASGEMFLIEPSSEHAGYCFVSRLDTQDAAHTYTRRPVLAAWVETVLMDFGLQDPSAATWRTHVSAGVLEALGTFEEVAA